MIRTTALGCALLISAGGAAAADRPVGETKVIAQSGAPLEITQYGAAYVEGGRYTTEGIHHNLTVRNASPKTVLAYEVGLVSFDVFNEFLDRTGGISVQPIKPGETDKGAWNSRAYADFSFNSSRAYVSRVRFEDGEVWKADMAPIIAELRRVEATFNEDRLKPPADKKQ